MGKFDTSQVSKEITIYERVTGSEGDPPSKWRSKTTPDGQRLYFTGRTIHVVQALQGNTFIGMSRCNPTDAFDKTEGKRRARDRAFGAYLRYEYNKTWSLDRGISTFAFRTYKGDQITGAMLVPIQKAD